jgi:hypothetical protein
MDVEIVRAEDGAIEFHSQRVGGMFYDISKGQRLRGYLYWTGHLSEKRWFTTVVAEQFAKAWEDQL